MRLRFFDAALARLRSWMRSFLRRNRLEASMEAELTHHLESLTADLIRKGQSPADASRNARIALGSTLTTKEGMRASLGLRWWDQFCSDLRYALRILRKSPGFTAVAVGSLALGIGANTAIFTVAQHMLLDRLNVPNPEQLRMFYLSQPRDGVVNEMWGWWDDLPGGEHITTSFTYPVYEQLRRQNRTLAR